MAAGSSAAHSLAAHSLAASNSAEHKSAELVADNRVDIVAHPVVSILVELAD